MLSVMKFPPRQRKNFLLLTISTAHTGSLFIATFELSATPIPIGFCLLSLDAFFVANGILQGFLWLVEWLSLRITFVGPFCCSYLERLHPISTSG